MKKYIFILAFLFGTFILQAQSFKIVINSSNSTSALSAKEISDIFLKKTAKWSNSESIIPVDLSSKSGIREDFSKAIHNKSVGAVKSYWQQYVFAGKGTPPVEKNTDEEVLEIIRKTPGAIGYVSSGANTSGLKVITLK